MKRISIFSVVILGVSLMCSMVGFAQNQGATRGNLAGTVLDSTKAVVPGAAVTITGPIGSQTQTSSPQGGFLFSNLIPGPYSVKVEKQGFAAITVPGIEVLINNTATVDVTIQTAGITSTIEVTATSVATVDTGSTSVNSDLSDTLYNNIPMQRNVSSIIMLAPGVVTGLGTSSSLAGSVHTVVGSPASYSNPSISGASGLENLYVADGVVLNDPSFGGIGGFSAVYGPLGVGITPAFVKEEEVKTAGFEPQYGHATGGVIQIVTKSGSEQMHGQIGGYFASPGMQTLFLNKDDFNPLNLLGRQLNNGQYEADFELGGYVPHLKNHLFYFGAFDPTFFNDYEVPAVGSGLFTIYNGHLDRRTNTYAYAGKLTYKFNDSINIESSVFGDPAHTNHVPISTLDADNTSGNSQWDFGTRNVDVRLYASITPTWEADIAFSYAWNHFTETQADTTIYPIEDQTQTGGLPGQRGDFTAQGLGTGLVINYQSHSEALAFDTSKIFKFAGTHTFSAGYFWQYPTYDDVTKYSFNTYAIPGTNATGGSAGTSAAAGQISDASLQLQLAPASCTLCPLMNVPGFSTPQPVALFQIRGRFDGGISHNTGKYHAAYVNDAWQMSPHVTLNVGLRWEQQRLTGTASRAFFGDQWSPRVGFVVSPNPDSKIYVDFDRLAFVLPLDMAVRELSSEEDNTGEFWAPAADSSNMVTFDQYGTVNFVPDAAHLLNGATGGIAKAVSIQNNSSGEPFVPGSRMEYNDEWVVGAEHKFRGGFNASARYINRRMNRVVEDMVGQSVEQFTALAFNNGAFQYVIGNPSATFAHFVTPNEITWTPTATQIAAFNTESAVSGSTFAQATALLGPPAGCFDSANNPTPFMSGPMFNTFGTLVGAACFPAVNGQLNTSSSALFGGEYFPGTCPTNSNGRSFCQPGLYPNAARNYQAIEFEVNKTFSNNWQLHSNFRIGSLRGNYEGAFRNDNSQSDPGISSLFDLTSGSLGLLGQQLGIGPLNTDRKYVLNVEANYVIPRSFAKNLSLGTALTVETGVPLTTLAAQQIYGNAGEVPIFGRGDLGTSPTTGTIDAHLEYPIHLGERKQLKLQFDAFNIANTKRPILTTQHVDLSFQVLNQDFTDHIPLSFVPPFSARGSVLFTF